jgi:D-arabinono-1,4-lactone oxidase
MATIPIGADGLYHPSSEDEIAALVQHAAAEGLQIRVRGAVHSVAQAIYTDPGPGQPPVSTGVSEQAPPHGPHLNLMLDRYRTFTWIDVAQGIVEVEAGLNVGWDPYDPTHTSTLENSLLYQAWLHGWTLRDLGGITHQTVSGFLATGSAGGSLQYPINENLLAFRLIDASGQARWIAKADKPDLFDAVGVSMGLLGIISKIRLKLTPTFNIYGQECTTRTALEHCPIDLFGPGRHGKRSLQAFLEQVPYTRLLWWPQPGVERVVIWQARVADPVPDFTPITYKEFGAHPELVQLVGNFFYTLIGNLDDLAQVPSKLTPSFAQFADTMALIVPHMRLGPEVSTCIARIIAALTEGTTDILTALLTPLAPMLRAKLPEYLPKIINLFQPLTGQGTPIIFQDYAWRSLPMDTSADDRLMGTEFTELWMPITKTVEVMQTLQQFFTTGGLTATGTYAIEIYGAAASNFWLSPSYKEPVMRVDVFWFSKNAGHPSRQGGFYDQFWKLLKPLGFRLHWGKGLPEYDYPGWAQYFRQQWPKLNDFLALREQMDPQGLFLTAYWKRHLYGG